MMFVYTDHPDVPSSTMDGKVDWMVAIQRRMELLEIQRENDIRAHRHLGLDRVESDGILAG